MTNKADKTEKDREYKKRERRKLKEDGLQDVTVALDKDTLNKLRLIAENMKLAPPLPGKNTIKKSDSKVIKKYLTYGYIKHIYEPKSPTSENILLLFNRVDHCVQKKMTFKQIITHMKQKKYSRPKSITIGQQSWISMKPEPWTEADVKKW